MKKTLLAVLLAAASPLVRAADISDYDPRMAVERSVVTNGVRWIEGLDLPMEGRMFADVTDLHVELRAIALNQGYDILPVACCKVVEAANTVARLKQVLTEVRADKAGTTCD